MRVQFKRAPLLNRPATPAKKTVVLSDGVITDLSGKPEVLRRCPYLRIATAPVRGCKCRRNAVQRTADVKEFGRIRKSVVSAAPESIAFLKSILHADVLVVYTLEPSGTVKNLI